MAPTITRDELRQAIDAGSVTVIETLRDEHFAQGHAAIVTYCSNTACRNSEAAANQLIAMGYTDVRKYAGGKQDWQEAGLPLETEVAS